MSGFPVEFHGCPYYRAPVTDMHPCELSRRTLEDTPWHTIPIGLEHRVIPIGFIRRGAVDGEGTLWIDYVLDPSLCGEAICRGVATGDLSGLSIGHRYDPATGQKTVFEVSVCVNGKRPNTRTVRYMQDGQWVFRHSTSADDDAACWHPQRNTDPVVREADGTHVYHTPALYVEPRAATGPTDDPLLLPQTELPAFHFSSSTVVAAAAPAMMETDCVNVSPALSVPMETDVESSEVVLGTPDEASPASAVSMDMVEAVPELPVLSVEFVAAEDNHGMGMVPEVESKESTLEPSWEPTREPNREPNREPSREPNREPHREPMVDAPPAPRLRPMANGQSLYSETLPASAMDTSYRVAVKRTRPDSDPVTSLATPLSRMGIFACSADSDGTPSQLLDDVPAPVMDRTASSINDQHREAAAVLEKRARTEWSQVGESAPWSSLGRSAASAPASTKMVLLASGAVPLHLYNELVQSRLERILRTASPNPRAQQEIGQMVVAYQRWNDATARPSGSEHRPVATQSFVASVDDAEPVLPHELADSLFQMQESILSTDYNKAPSREPLTVLASDQRVHVPARRPPAAQVAPVPLRNASLPIVQRLSSSGSVGVHAPLVVRASSLSSMQFPAVYPDTDALRSWRSFIL